MLRRFPSLAVFALAGSLFGGPFGDPPAGAELQLRLDLYGDRPSDGFGSVVVAAGDFDADGQVDLAVSAPGGAAQGRGEVVVFSGADGHELRRLTGQAPGAQFGKGLSGGADVDGDGVPDLFIGAPGLAPGGPSSGAALLYSGGLGKVVRSVRGAQRYEFLGDSVLLAPDLDGDGRGDLLIGAMQDRNEAGTITGSARAVGSADGELLWIRRGQGEQDTFGFALTVVGDLDGDGTADLAVGALENDAAGPDAGQVLVLSGRDGAVLHDLRGQLGADRFGSALAGLGDVDGDGLGDLAVGAPGHDLGGDSAGTIFVHSGADMRVLFAVAGREPGDELGTVLAAAGDVDGDGVPDILAAALQDYSGRPGYALLLSGKDGAVLATVEGDDAHRGTGFSLAGLGDLDGDGRAEVAVGTSYSRRGNRAVGRVRVLGLSAPAAEDDR